MSEYSEKEQVYLIKEKRYFNYKKRGHTAYNCPKKVKIATILEDIKWSRWELRKKIAPSKVKEKSLFVSWLFMPKNLFCESFCPIHCTLGNKIKITILVNTCTIEFSFINKKFAKIICKRLKI